MTAGPSFIEYRDALFNALAGSTTGTSDAEPAALLRRLAVGARQIAPSHPFATPIFDRLYEVGANSRLEQAIETALTRFESASAFREAIFLARCMARDAHATFDLLAARGYLSEAQLPRDGSHADLVTDREAVLDTLAMETLWHEPARLGGLINLVQIWKQEYFRSYAAAHHAYNTTLGSSVEQMESKRRAAVALSRLNTLRRLGPPVAVAALEHHAALERLFPCPAQSAALASMLAAEPSCTECGFKLGDVPPVTDMRRVIAAIEQGLGLQQERLARHVVARILAQPPSTGDDQVERFLRVVQASDLDGLAHVIDDGLLRFLDTLLSRDPPDLNPLASLARTFPTVSVASADAAVDEFRRLLTDALSREGIVRLRHPDDSAPHDPSPEEP